MENTRQKEKFIELYQLLIKRNYIQHHLITMGNLALFSDKLLGKNSSVVLEKEMKKFLDKGLKQEMLYLIAKAIYDVSKRDELGENLEYRFNRIQQEYKSGKLHHFDILLDDFDFPDWFKYYIPYVASDNIKRMSEFLLRDLRRFKAFNLPVWTIDDSSQLLIFMNKIYKNEKRWSYLFPVIDAIWEEDSKQVKLLLQKV